MDTLTWEMVTTGQNTKMADRSEQRWFCCSLYSMWSFLCCSLNVQTWKLNFDNVDGTLKRGDLYIYLFQLVDPSIPILWTELYDLLEDGARFGDASRSGDSFDPIYLMYFNGCLSATYRPTSLALVQNLLDLNIIYFGGITCNGYSTTVLTYDSLHSA